MKLLLDEMYSASLAEGLSAIGLGAATVREFGLGGYRTASLAAQQDATP